METYVYTHPNNRMRNIITGIISLSGDILVKNIIKISQYWRLIKERNYTKRH